MLNKIKQFFANLEQKAKQDMKDIWNQDKGYFFAFGALIVMVKFRDLIISILLGSAKRVDSNAEKKDEVLAGQEKKYNDQADALVQQAQQEPSKEQPITDDWNKK